MKFTRTSVLTAFALLIGGFIGASALVALAGWTGAPAGGPPNDNVPAPINVGGGGVVGTINNYVQTKTGLLGLNALQFQPGGEHIATGSVMVAADQYGTVAWGTANNSSGSIANLYSIVWSTATTSTDTSWTNTGLFITAVPTAASSKFLINANLVANNGSASNNCDIGLFNGNTLLVKVASVDNAGGNGDADTWGTSYVDQAGNTTSRTYMMKVAGNCYLNRSNSGSFFASSTMTVMEIK